MKRKGVHIFVITTFVLLYLVVSVISTIHVIDFFDLTNPKWLSVSLAIAFELGAAASLASIIVLDKMNKFMIWSLFITLTAMQAMGNTYFAYTNLSDFTEWSELFGLIEEDPIFQKRVLSVISGAILPLVSLGFIKSLVDYIRPEKEEKEDTETIEEIEEDIKEEVDRQNGEIFETEYTNEPTSENKNGDINYSSELPNPSNSTGRRNIIYYEDPTKMS